MSKLEWDVVGNRFFETGSDHGVLYTPNAQGVYNNGFAWNGLVSVTQSPSGAEASPQYADNIKYLNLVSNEEFGATLEAFTYPREFLPYDGVQEIAPGVSVGQQARGAFGLSYRSKLGNDLKGADYGYKLHLIYGALAAPTEKAHTTVNDTPEAVTFSWEITTSPVEVPGLRPTAILTIDSTKVDATKLAQLEAVLYGAPGIDPRLPLPVEVASIFGTTIAVEATAPTYNSATKTITFPTITGLEYLVGGTVQTAPLVITKDTVVTARTKQGYRFTETSDDDWTIKYV